MPVTAAFPPALWLLAGFFIVSPSLLGSPVRHASGQASTQVAQTSVQTSSVLQQAVAALLGYTVLSDVTLSGTAHRIAGSEDDTGTVTYRATSGGAVRYDFSYSSGPQIEVHAAASSGPVGMWSGPDGVTHSLALHNLTNRADIFPSFTLAPLVSAANLTVMLVGVETKNTHSVYHVSVFQQAPQLKPKSAALFHHLTQTEIFLDTSTLLPVALDFTTHPDDDAGVDIPVELAFSDYRSVAGAQIPFRVQKYLNNGLVLDLQFQTASVNSGLSASLFNVQ